LPALSFDAKSDEIANIFRTSQNQQQKQATRGHAHGSRPDEFGQVPKRFEIN
jgi:hypothetical protein